MKLPDLEALDSRDLWEAEDLVEAALTLAAPCRAPVLESLRQYLRRAQRVELPTLRRLLDGARERIDEQARQERARKKPKGRGAPDSHPLHGWTLRHEQVKCGKPGCDKLHGPYWYGYRSVGNRTCKHYFGKKKPTPAMLTATLGKDVAGDLEPALPKKPASGRMKKKGHRP